MNKVIIDGLIDLDDGTSLSALCGCDPSKFGLGYNFRIN